MKRIIATSYNKNSQGKFAEYDGITLRTGLLDYDGSYDSPELARHMEDADVIITNPPFSKWRDYYDHIHTQWGRDFLILGNHNSVSYYDLFQKFKSGQVRTGVNIHPTTLTRPDGSVQKLGDVVWYTSLNVPPKPHLKLCSNPSMEYPKIDNYPNAIYVETLAEIPDNYYQEMGVPQTFLKFGDDRFDIIGILHPGRNANDLGAEKLEVMSAGKLIKWNGTILNGKCKFNRVIIKRKPNT